MQNIIYAAASLSIMGFLFALLLGFASKIFAVEVDERIPQVRECLPGANCGGCGYPGCDGLAAAIVAGTAPVNGCPVGGAAAAEKIGKVMGIEAGSGEKMVAHVHCNGGCNAKDKAKYEAEQNLKKVRAAADKPRARPLCARRCVSRAARRNARSGAWGLAPA